jgi:hypothetical protein
MSLCHYVIMSLCHCGADGNARFVLCLQGIPSEIEATDTAKERESFVWCSTYSLQFRTQDQLCYNLINGVTRTIKIMQQRKQDTSDCKYHEMFSPALSGKTEHPNEKYAFHELQ